MQLRLVGQRHIGLAGGDQLGRHGGIGRLDQIDLQPLLGKVALLLSDDQRAVIGVDEPVEQQFDLVGCQYLCREQAAAQQCSQSFHAESPRFIDDVDSSSQGVSRRAIRLTEK